MKKQHKDAKLDRDKAKIDLELAEDKVRDMELMMKESEYYNEKLNNINKSHMLKEVNQHKNRLAKLK